MTLTDAQLGKLQELYKSKFSIELSKDEAKDKGHQLVSIMQLVYKPMPETVLKPLAETELKPLQPLKLQKLEFTLENYNEPESPEAHQQILPK